MCISILYMFPTAMFSSSGESIVSIRHLVYVTLYRWPSSMQAWMELHPSLHTRRSPIQSDIYQMSYWCNWLSWWWARGCSKHVENWNKHIRKKNCASSWLFTRIVLRCTVSKTKSYMYVFRSSQAHLQGALKIAQRGCLVNWWELLAVLHTINQCTRQSLYATCSAPWWRAREAQTCTFNL